MWERISAADLQEIKSSLSRKRTEILSRHAEEIKELDAQEQDIDSFERVVAAFVEEYLTPGAATEASAVATDRRATLVDEAGASENIQRDGPPSELRVHQNISPSFGIPFRRFARPLSTKSAS